MFQRHIHSDEYITRFRHSYQSVDKIGVQNFEVRTSSVLKMVPDYITQCIHRIAKQQKMKNYEIEAHTGSNKNGDNFLDIMIAITLTNTRGENDACKHEKLHLLCKMPPLSAVRRKNFGTKLIFEREIYVYTKLLPAFIKFQHERGLSETDAFLSFPKVYASECDAVNDIYFLILEDLRYKFYRMWPKEKVIPIDFELRIMQELGKLHAISFAMQDQQPHQFDELKHLNDIMYEIAIRGKVKIYVDKTIERAIRALENPKHKQIMQHFRNTYVQKLDELMQGTSSQEFAVVCHGDCWSNNFLFQLDSYVSGRHLSLFFPTEINENLHI